MFIISAYPESVNTFFLFFKKIYFYAFFKTPLTFCPKISFLRHFIIHFCGFVLPFCRFTPVFCLCSHQKHRLRNRNFSLLLCKITLKMHKNKFFCISHFTLFEQNCYKSCNNIKLYLRFLQIILYIYSRFCKIMPYYSHTFTAPLPRHYSCIRIYARTHMHAQYMHTHIHTHNCTCKRTRSIYIRCFWLSCLARIYKYEDI